jgi:hypothetical protein
MLRVIFFAGLVAMALALVCAGLWLGRHIPFSQQWPLYEALRGTASIIFAVVGAWLAIIYPERLKLSFGKQGTAQPGLNNSNVGLLLTPAIHSTILLVVLLLIGVMVPMLKQLPMLADHIVAMRGVSFGLLVLLTCWQIAIVVITIFPAEMLQSSISVERARAQIDEQRGKLRRHSS